VFSSPAEQTVNTLSCVCMPLVIACEMKTRFPHIQKEKKKRVCACWLWFSYKILSRHRASLLQGMLTVLSAETSLTLNRRRGYTGKGEAGEVNSVSYAALHLFPLQLVVWLPSCNHPMDKELLNLWRYLPTMIIMFKMGIIIWLIILTCWYWTLADSANVSFTALSHRNRLKGWSCWS